MNHTRFCDERLLDRTEKRENASYWEATSEGGIVCTAHYRATEAGVDMLSRGGNAVDAAVAASLALGVVEPAASGLGGMAMMLGHVAESGRTFMLEGPCRAPAAATPEAVMRCDRKLGYGAVAVPTYPALIDHVLRHYGTMSLSAVAQPAIALAQAGYRITPLQHELLHDYRESILKGNAASLLHYEHGQPPPSGTTVRNPQLARTLKRFALGGAEEFYHGEVGHRILEDMAANGGFISRRDFKNVPWPAETTPLQGRFQDWEVHTTAPPGGGVSLLQMLTLFEVLGHDGVDLDACTGATLLAEIIRKARRDRRRLRLHLTRQWVLANLSILCKMYVQETACRIRERLSGVGETTHLNAIDRWGNIVALTQSIERSFGAKVAGPGLGFLYNGFMKGFKIQSRRHPHYLRPGAVARSNACPSILCGAGGDAYAIGSTGSERMASGMFQVLVRMRTQSPFEAVKAPRLHCTPEGEVMCEAERLDPTVLEHLSARGFEITPYKQAWAFGAGGLQLAGITRGVPWGVADPRRDGLAAGPD